VVPPGFGQVIFIIAFVVGYPALADFKDPAHQAPENRKAAQRLRITPILLRGRTF
jgi:hypothetical protein